MKDILLYLNFDMEDVNDLINKLNKYPLYKIKSIINLFISNGINKAVIREIILNKDYIFNYEVDRVKYILDAITSNNDIIDETILELL